MAKKALRRRQKWNAGDLFLIGLKDGTCIVGQVIARERQALNSVGIALFNMRINRDTEIDDVAALTSDRLVAVLLATHDLLGNGTWRVIGNRPVRVPVKMIPYERFRSKDWIGADITGSGIINEFVNAYFGLVPWDDWHDPNYLDGLLLSLDKKSSDVMLKDDLR